MIIKHTLESLSIQTSDDELFTKLSQLISKNFQKTIQTKGKLISFYDESELPQKKYFLKFLKKLYESKFNQNINLNFAEYKTIKLGYIKENTLTKVINAKVFFEKDEITFTLIKADKIFFSYILQSFKGNKFKISPNETRLNLKINKESDFEALKILFSKREHLTFLVNFNFKQDEFEKFEKHYMIQNSKQFNRRFSALAGLLEKNFEILQCDKNSSFEDVRESYIGLVKIYHPDRNIDKSLNLQRVYREKFEEIQIAYENLKPFFKSQEAFMSA